jgi:hypothetical protein
MGLDITAVSKLKPIEIPDHLEQWSDEYYDWEMEQEGSIVNIYTHDAFPEASEGLEDGAYLELGERYGFRAGSYSGYGMWREWMASAIMQGILGKTGGASTMWGRGDEGDYGLPFMELINFSDAEGIIGPVASKKLYNDFRQYENDVMDWMDHQYLTQTPMKQSWRDEEVKPMDKEDFEWFHTKYKDWKEAFRIASDNGAVIFQ